MPELSREVIEHKLNISFEVKLVVQKKRNLRKERNEVVGCEVKKLLDSRFIREVCFLKWLDNVVMVRVPRSGGCVETILT